MKERTLALSSSVQGLGNAPSKLRTGVMLISLYGKKRAVLEGVTGVLNQSLVLNGKIIPGQFIHRLPLDLDVEASPGLQITTPDF